MTPPPKSSPPEVTAPETSEDKVPRTASANAAEAATGAQSPTNASSGLSSQATVHSSSSPRPTLQDETAPPDEKQTTSAAEPNRNVKGQDPQGNSSPSHGGPARTTLLGPGQTRILATAITTLAVFTLLAGLALAVVLLGRFLSTFSAVLWPIAVAALLALTLHPIVSLAEHKLRMPRNLSVAVLYLLTITLIGAFVSLILPGLIEEVVAFADTLGTVAASIEQWVRSHFPKVPLWVADLEAAGYADAMRGGLESSIAWLASSSTRLLDAGKHVMDLAVVFAGLCLIPVYLTYFLLLKRNIREDLQEQLRFLPRDSHLYFLRIVDDFVNIMVAFFRGQLLVGLMTGIILALGFYAIGLQLGVLVGLLLGVFNLIPYLGTIFGIIILIPLGYFQSDGGMPMVLYALGVLTTGQLIESYVLAPRIMEKETGLHPVVIIMAVVFWGTALNGILGMMLGIPLTAFLVSLWRFLRDEYASDRTSHVVKEPNHAPLSTASSNT